MRTRSRPNNVQISPHLFVVQPELQKRIEDVEPVAFAVQAGFNGLPERYPGHSRVYAVPVFGELPIGRVAQNRDNPGFRRLGKDVSGSRPRPQVTDAGLPNRPCPSRALKQLQVVGPFRDHPAETQFGHGATQIFVKRFHVAPGMVAHPFTDVLDANFRGEVVRLLDWTHVDLRMLAHVVVERSGPGLGSTHQKKLGWTDRKSTRLNSSHRCISYAVFCLKKKDKPLAPSESA